MTKGYAVTTFKEGDDTFRIDNRSWSSAADVVTVGYRGGVGNLVIPLNLAGVSVEAKDMIVVFIGSIDGCDCDDERMMVLMLFVAMAMRMNIDLRAYFCCC